MQTITDKTEIQTFLRNMSCSFSDLSSWQGWYAFEFSATKPLEWTQQAKIASLIHATFPDNEGAVLWVDGGIICVMRIASELNIADVTQGLYELSITSKIGLRMLCVAEEHEQLLALIDRYAEPSSVSPRASSLSYADLKNLVPGIDALLGKWQVAKQQRVGRDKPLIMVVDDDKMLVTLVSHILKQDYQVITASTGRQAIEDHIEYAPDVVFLDIRLPDCDGLSILHYMQQYDREGQIIMFTSDNYLKTQVNALASGANGFVPKPFSKEAFENYIERWMAGEERKKKSRAG